MITLYPWILSLRRLVRFLGAMEEQISEESVKYKIARSAINAWHAHFASYTVRHNTIYITLYFSGPGVSTQLGEGRWRPTHTQHSHSRLLYQCSVLDTKTKKNLVKGCTKFPKILEPPQNCLRY